MTGIASFLNLLPAPGSHSSLAILVESWERIMKLLKYM